MVPNTDTEMIGSLPPFTKVMITLTSGDEESSILVEPIFKFDFGNAILMQFQGIGL
jgi:hypothetical protein